MPFSFWHVPSSRGSTLVTIFSFYVLRSMSSVLNGMFSAIVDFSGAQGGNKWNNNSKNKVPTMKAHENHIMVMNSDNLQWQNSQRIYRGCGGICAWRGSEDWVLFPAGRGTTCGAGQVAWSLRYTLCLLVSWWLLYSTLFSSHSFPRE